MLPPNFALEWNPGDFDIVKKESAGRVQVKYEDWAITIYPYVGAHSKLLRKISSISDIFGP